MRTNASLHENGKRLTVKELVARLTPKQRKFAEGLVLNGLSKAQAYREAYTWNGGESGLRVNAVRTAQKPNVALAVKAMEEERAARWWENKRKLQTFVMDGLTRTASETESDITRLKALELVGRTRYASVFEEPQANEANAALSGAMVDTLAARLQSLLGFSAPISGAEDSSGPILDTECTQLPSSDMGDADTPTGGGEGE